MSEDKNKGYTSILLPDAQVMLFSSDEETVKSFSALEDDWRFARVTLSVKEGDLDTATKYYAQNDSPDLVLVQTDDIAEDFSDSLEALAGNCAEDTAAIVIGPDNDVDLYRKLVGMGVSDYLVRPILPQDFGDNIAATLIEKVGVNGSRLIAVMGAKGGVGATTLAQMFAWGLSEDLAQKTLLLDAAGGWSTLAVGMDFEPVTTLAEASRAAEEGNEDSLGRMMFSASDKLTVLSSGGDVMLDDSLSAEQYEVLLDYFMATYPFVVVDLSGSTAALKRIVLSRAHRIIVTTSPCLSSVRAARTLFHEIKELRGGADDASCLVLNMKGMSPKNEVSKAQIEEGVEQNVAAVLSFEPDLFTVAESAGKRLSSQSGGDVLSAAILPLIKNLVGGKALLDSDAAKGKSEKGALSSFLGKLKTKS